MVPRASLARARCGRLLVLAVALGTLAAVLGRADGRPDRDGRVPLRPGRLAFPSRPPSLVHPVGDGIPAALVPGGVATEVRGKALLVDVSGGGRPTRRVKRSRPAVLEVGPQEARVPVLLWHGDGRWWGERAGILKGDVRSRRVAWAPPFTVGGESGRGWLRWDDGAFRPVGDPTRVQVADGWLALTVHPDAKGGRLAVARTARPEGVSDDRWRGLVAVNAFRNRTGLAPVDLDDERCDASQAHAAYIVLNPRDGFGHAEIEGRPGYSDAGREAARLGVMERTGDPAVAVARLTAMMLHRPPFLDAVEIPLGVGVVHDPAGHRGYGAEGFTVFWAGGKYVGDRFPILVPAPGQRDVPRHIVVELPSPEGRPGYYDTPRGYPVSVSFLPGSAKNVCVRLRRVARDEAVEGDLFTPESPVHSNFAHNLGTAFFTASKPLEKDTVYEATYTANHGGEAVHFCWRFETGD